MARVLVVDDDPDLRSALLGVLSDEGFTVEVAHDGREAFNRLCAGPHPDAILLDLVMPVMNGWQFRARQLALPAFAGIPTIVMTALGNLRHAAITADHFLAKPIKVAQLRATMDRCLSGAYDDSPTDPWLNLPQQPMQPPMRVAAPTWRLVPPRRNESCRWEDASGRWVVISMGDGEELGMAVVESWRGGRNSFDRYEDALRFCNALRD